MHLQRAPVLPFRVGHGFDLHRLEPGLPLIIGGISIPHDRGCDAHSDGDVLLHCVVDAILGALGLPDIGQLFPDNDPKWRGADSSVFLKEAVKLMHQRRMKHCLVDLRVMDNCLAVTKGVDHVCNLAADMGGMGFIQSNHSVIMYNNTMISFNMLEAARINGVKRFFYASSACIYPKFKQLETNVSLKESDAGPAEPQDAYGLEKLATEELCKHYNKDFGIECRIGRFHNIYGPFGTWKGGREKAPAAFCRKTITSTDRFEMWGNGEQTRSFTFIDECVKSNFSAGFVAISGVSGLYSEYGNNINHVPVEVGPDIHLEP
jgi:2C-methyl-D-erythritol 2,4-cyclodiphosphate synthase